MANKRILTLGLIGLLLLVASNKVAARDKTENRFVDATVTEVTESSIAILASSGVEHVIAFDKKKTKVMLEGKEIVPGELKAGDVVTVVLDEKNPLKLARQIDLNSRAGDQLAQNRRR